jgi:hypothetical protein
MRNIASMAVHRLSSLTHQHTKVDRAIPRGKAAAHMIDNDDNCIQWMFDYFGDCISTQMDQLSFYLGLVSLASYMLAFLPQFVMQQQRAGTHDGRSM